MTQAVTELIVRGDGALATLDRFEEKMVDAGRASESSTGAIDRYNAVMAKMSAAQEKGLAITTQRVERLTAEQRAMEAWQARADPLMKLEIQLRRDAQKAAVDSANAVILGYASQEQALATLTKLEQSHAAQLASFKQSGVQGAAGIATVGTAAKLTSNQMLNLSRQGNDVITMFALGAPPMQIFASQAGQIYDALEQGPAGIKGSLKAIGEGAVSLATRFPLATAAIAAASVAVAAYMMFGGSDIRELDDILKEHEANIKRLGDAYEAVNGKRAKYASDTANTVNALNEGALEDARDLLAGQVKMIFDEVYRQIGGGGGNQGPLKTVLRSQFEPFEDALARLAVEARKANPDITSIRNEIADIAKADPRGLNKVRDALLEMLDPVQKTAETLPGLAKPVGELVDVVDQFKRQLDEVSAKPIRDELEKIFATARDGVVPIDAIIMQLAKLEQANPSFQGVIDGFRDLIKKAYEASTALDTLRPGGSGPNSRQKLPVGILPDTAPIPELRPSAEDVLGKAADKAAKSYDKLVDSAQRRLDQMQTELSLVGRAGAAAEAYRMEQDLLSRAKEQEIDLTPKQIEQIHELANAYGLARQKIDEARLASDLMFERQQIGRSDVEQRVADQLRNLYGDDYQSHMNGAIAGQIRYNDELKKSGELGKEAFDGIIDALTSSGDLVDNLISAFAQLGKQFQKIGSQKLFDFISGKSSSLFGDMPSVGGGGASVVNARASGTAMGQVIAPPIVSSLNTGLETYAAAIRKIESGSYEGNYGAIGPVVKTGAYAGDRALGAYQVMGNNVASWTKAATGVALTQQQFLNDRAAQDKVFYSTFGKSMDKYGNALDAISVHFSGRPVARAGNASDGYNTVPEYVSKVQNAADAYPGGLKRGVSDGFVDANRRISATNQIDPWSGMRETSVATNAGGNGFQGALGTLGMGIGSFASGMQSADPLSGALGGALSGIAMGPVGMVIGAVAGLIGGLLGKSKQKKEELKKAQQELENQIGAITSLMRTATGNYLGAMEKQFGDTVDEFQKAISLAQKAKNSKLVNQLKDAQEQFFDRLVDDWNSSFEGVLGSLNAGLGMDGQFLKGMDAVDKMRESLVGFVNDAKFFAEANGDLSKMLDARKRELGIGAKKEVMYRPSDTYKDPNFSRDDGIVLHQNEFVEGYKDIGLQLLERGVQAFNKEGGQLYTTLTELKDAAVRAGLAIDEQGKVTVAMTEAIIADAVARAQEAARATALASLSGGKSFTEIEQAIQRLEGAAASLPDLLKTLGMSAEDAADAIDHHLNYALDNLRKNYINGLNASINDLSDFGFLNEIIAAQDKYRDRLIETGALGLDGSLALKEFNLSLAKTIKGADLTEKQIGMLAAAFPAIAGIIDMLAGKDLVRQVEDAKSALQAAYDKEKSAIEQTISRLEIFTKAIKTFRDEMRLNASTPLGQADQVAEAAKQFRELAQKAMGGDQDAMDKLTGVSQSYLDEAREYYASSEDYFKIWNEVDKTLAEVESKAGRQLTEQQKQLAALDKQVAGLITINDSVLTVAQAIANLNAALGARDKALQDQINAAKGAGQTADPFITSLYKSVLNRAPDADGAAYYNAFLKAGMSHEDLRKKFIENAQPELKRGYPQFALGGDHMGGLRIVGERGPELEATGASRIFNAQQTERMLRQSLAPQPAGNDNSGAEMLKELQAVRAQLERLERGQSQTTAAVGASGAAITGAVERGNEINRETGSAMKRVGARV